nr:hypothetical protein [Parachlamydia sp. AcF125]
MSHLLFAENKIYVAPEQLIFEKNGLFVSTDDSILPLSQLSHDKQGFYFYPEDICLIPGPNAWVCLMCGHDNWSWQGRCTQCNHRPQ